MHQRNRLVAVVAALLSVLAVVAVAQQPTRPASPSASPGQTLILEGNLDWKEKSDVAALREGVIKQIEFNVGDLIKSNEPIGVLHDEMAKLSVAKAQVAANSTGAIKRGEAQRQRAMNELAIRKNLGNKPGMVTYEERVRYESEVLIADSMVQEATENQKIAAAELAIAQRALEEHTIRAPFTGFVTDRMKSAGEAVQANEAVLRLGRIDQLRFFGYVPLEQATLVTLGDRVEVTPVIDDADLPIERKKFAGKVTAISREVSTVNRTEIQVLAEITLDPADLEQPRIGSQLMAGMKGQMTIYLGTAGAQPQAQPEAAQAAVSSALPAAAPAPR